MKKILSLGLAALLALASASTVLADDGIMLISENEEAVAVAVAAAPNVAISNAAAQAAWLALEDKDEIMLDMIAALATASAGTPLKLYDEPVDVLIIDGVVNGDASTAPLKSRYVTIDNERYTYSMYKNAISTDGDMGFVSFNIPQQVAVSLAINNPDGTESNEKLMAARGATRTFDIPQVDGYVSTIAVGDADPVAAKSVKFKNVQGNIDATIGYQKMVSVTPTYVETFEGESTIWVSGGTAETAVAADGVLTEVSNGGDPNINADLSSLELTTDKVDAVIVSYVNGTENTTAQLFYATEGNPNYSEAGSVKAAVLPGANIAVFLPADGEGFTGAVNSMRLDPSNGEGTIAVDSIVFVDIDGIVTSETTAEAPAEEEATAVKDDFSLASVVRN